MKIKTELKNDPAQSFGDAPEEEYTFLLVPVAVYAAVSQQARKEQCSVGEVFQKALLQYLQAAERAERQPVDRLQVVRPEPAITVKKRR